MSIVPSDNYEEAERAIEEALKQIDGLDLIRKKRVFLKINLMKGAPPERAINTHPLFIRSMIRLVKKLGGEAVVGDSSGLCGFTEEALRFSGIADVLKEEGVRFLNGDAEVLFRKEYRGNILKEMWIPEELRNFDLLVTLPKFKTHPLTTLTGALKNQMGLLPGALKPAVHRIATTPEKLGHALVDINRAMPFHLAVMDGILALEGGGSMKGRPRKLGLVMASMDLLALDVVAAHIAGIDPKKVVTIRAGRERGIGAGELEMIKIVGHIPDTEPFLLPSRDLKANPILGRFLYKIRERAILPRIRQEICDGCGMCVNICPVDAIEGGRVMRIEDGSCIGCFVCYHKCPNRAIERHVSWYMRPFVMRRFQNVCQSKK
ncbi:MAG: DUF362 domain-containing protein [Candidatus Bathyarchaeia archaeon]